jgi:hypothetical protein
VFTKKSISCGSSMYPEAAEYLMQEITGVISEVPVIRINSAAIYGLFMNACLPLNSHGG